MNTIATYIGAALILLCVALGVNVYTRGVEIDALTVTNKAQADKIATLNDNSATEAKAKAQADTVIADLNQRLSAEVGKTQHVEQLAQAANKRADANLRMAREYRDQITTQRETLYAQDQASNDWRATRVPPAISAGLLTEWNKARSVGLQDGHGSRDSRDQGPAIRTDSKPTHDDPYAAGLAAAYRWDATVTRSYTQGQLLDATSDALAGYATCAGQLREIRRLSDEATR